jgi:hypothetical protein
MKLWPSEESKGGGIEDLWSSWLESLNELTNPVAANPRVVRNKQLGRKKKP